MWPKVSLPIFVPLFVGWLSDGFRVNWGEERLLKLASTKSVQTAQFRASDFLARLALPDEHSAARKRRSLAVSVAPLTAHEV